MPKSSNLGCQHLKNYRQLQMPWGKYQGAALPLCGTPAGPREGVCTPLLQGAPVPWGLPAQGFARGQDPLLQKEGCGLAALPGSWLPQGETFLRAHILYGAKTNICSGGGTVAQPGHFVAPPCIIETISAGDVGPGTQHLALWPRGTRTALAKQECSTAQRWASRGSKVRGGARSWSLPGWGWLLPRLLSQPGASLGRDVGVAFAVLPSQTPPVAPPGSASIPEHQSQGAMGPHSPVLCSAAEPDHE